MSLREYRKEAGFKTQQSLADALGISRSMIAKWELGITVPGVFMAQKISKVLNKTEGEIINVLKLEKIID